MDTIPTTDEIALQLKPLNGFQLQRLALLSGIPFTTISKIRRKETKNPGIETVRRFVPHIAAVRQTIDVAAPKQDAMRAAA